VGRWFGCETLEDREPRKNNALYYRVSVIEIKMRILHQKLHLQHHQHSGKLLHHRHTSYRSLAVIFLLAGIFTGGLAIIQRVTAESLVSIYVTVHVPRPNAPALIALPKDNAVVPSGDTLIAGSCPILSPQAVVIVNVDSKNIGSAVCDASNNFSLTANLAAGQHTVLANATSIDGDTGPASTPLYITTRPITVKTPTPATSPAVLITDTPFTTIGASRDITWSGTITGSEHSYKLLLDWGDGTYASYDVKPGKQQLRHHYTNLAAYNVTLGLSDSAGNYQHIQYAAALSNDSFPNAAASSTNSTPSTYAKTATTIGLYGFFVTLVCVAAIIRLHAVPFAYTAITLEHHHAKN
jgi:hypothetical protein